MPEQIDYEIVAVLESSLLVRFSYGTKHRDVPFTWDGTGNVADQLTGLALSMIRALKAPPPPTFEQLQRQVGKKGKIDIPEAVPLPPTPPPPPMRDKPAE